MIRVRVGGGTEGVMERNRVKEMREGKERVMEEEKMKRMTPPRMKIWNAPLFVKPNFANQLRPDCWKGLRRVNDLNLHCKIILWQGTFHECTDRAKMTAEECRWVNQHCHYVFCLANRSHSWLWVKFLDPTRPNQWRHDKQSINICTVSKNDPVLNFWIKQWKINRWMMGRATGL